MTIFQNSKHITDWHIKNLISIVHVHLSVRQHEDVSLLDLQDTIFYFISQPIGGLLLSLIKQKTGCFAI